MLSAPSARQPAASAICSLLAPLKIGSRGARGALGLLALLAGFALLAPASAVAEVPPKPLPPYAQQLSTTSVRVEPGVPNANPPSTDAEMRYRVAGTATWSDHPFVFLGPKRHHRITISGLTPNTTYEVQVRAENANGWGPWSDSEVVSTSATVAPAAPAWVSVGQPTRENGRVTLSWAAVPRVMGYQYQQKQASGTCGTDGYGDWAPSGSYMNVTSHKIAVDGGARYCFRVRAVNAVGESAASVPADATVGVFPELRASAVAMTTAVLTLTNHTEAWWVKRFHPDAGSCTPVAAGTAQVDLSGLTAGTRHGYMAYSASGCAWANRIVGLWFRTAYATVPATPTGVSATLGARGVTLQWSEAARATGYQYQQKQASGTCGTDGYGDWASAGTGTYHVVTNLSNDLRYCFRLRAMNAAGESEASAEVFAITTLAAPTGVSAAQSGYRRVTLRWTAVAGATRYLYRYKARNGSDCTAGSWGDWRGGTTAPIPTRRHVTVPRNGPTYCFELLASGRYGRSSSTAVEVTLSPMAPLKTLPPSLYQASPTSMFVRFTGALDHQPSITDADLRYRVKGAATWSDHPFTLPPRGYWLKTTITGLTPNATYEVQTRHENATGAGPWSNSDEIVLSTAVTLTLGNFFDRNPFLDHYRFSHWGKHSYGRGDEIVVTMTSSQPVRVTGTPQVALDIGGVTRYADFVDLGDAEIRNSKLKFAYTIQAADTDTDGIEVPANPLRLNGGRITRRDDSTVNATLKATPRRAADPRLKVQGSLVHRPRTGVGYGSPTVGLTFRRGEYIDLHAGFDQLVYVTGSPRLRFEIGGATRYASLHRLMRIRGIRSRIDFRYRVQRSDIDTDGISIPANALELNGGSITRRDDRSVTADLTHSAFGPREKGRAYHVNGSLEPEAPWVTSVDLRWFLPDDRSRDTYTLGEKIYAGISFSYPVSVTGSPRLAMRIGANVRHAALERSYSSANTLLFSYRVQAGDRDTDGVSIAADSLDLNGGTIKLATDSSVNATLTHTAVADDDRWKVDGTATPSAPAAVPSVSAAYNGNTLQVSWDPAARATHYEVEYKASDATSWISAADHTARGVIILIRDATKTYTVRVKAKNSGGESAWTSSPPAAPPAPPAVASVSVDHLGSSLSVSWDASAGAAWYDVEYQASDATSWSSAATDHTTTSLTIGSVDRTKTYTVRVRAKGIFVGSPRGVSAWTTSEPASPPQQGQGQTSPPAQPAGFGAAPGDGQVTLSWTAIPGTTGWEVRRRTYLARPSDSWSAWTAIPGSGAATASHVVTGLANGARHGFQVRARNDHGAGPASDEAVARPVSATGTVPTAATGLTAEGRDGDAMLSWTWNRTANRWEYRQRTGSDGAFGDWMPMRSHSLTRRYIVGGLANGTEYGFQVRGVNARGVGPESSTATVTPAAPAGGPAKPAVTAEGGVNGVTLSWAADAAAAGWEYRYKVGDGNWSRALGAIQGSPGTQTGYKVNTEPEHLGVELAFQVRGFSGTEGSPAYGPWSDEVRATPQPPANAAPAFTSAAAFEVAENATAVGTVAAEDADPHDAVRYAIAGGVDEAMFAIDAITGALVFTEAPDHEFPQDSSWVGGGTEVASDNVYHVTVRATSGHDERRLTVEQAVTVTVANADEDPTGVPAVSGTAQVGGTLTADASGIADPDGLASPGWSWQWVRVAEGGAETDIAGATSGTYTPVSADAGGTLKVRVGFTDDGGFAESLTSAETAQVAAAAALAAPDASAEPNDARVTLHWAAVTGATQYAYRMKRVPAEGEDPTTFGVWTAAGGASATSKAVTELANGTAYVFEMRSGAEGGAWSAASAPVTATPNVPPAQAEIFIAAPFEGDIWVSVIPVANATGYEYRLKGAEGAPDGPWTAVSHSYDAFYDEDRFLLAGLGAGTHRFQVRAKTGEVPGPASAVWTETLASGALQAAVSLSVADASAREPGEGATASLDFAVTLSRAASDTVTVDYATRDGTATAGADYTAASGTLTFAAGETEKTVAVAVLPDSHDDTGETLTLALSNASGATISDAEATGTIVNDGPLQREWLARFGRTVTDQVVDAVTARLAAPRAAGLEATLAGEALPSWTPGSGSGAGPDGKPEKATAAAGSDGTEPDGDGERERASFAAADKRDAADAMRRLMTFAGADDSRGMDAGSPGSWPGEAHGAAGFGSAADFGTPGSGTGPGSRSGPGLSTRTVTGQDMLASTSFALTAGAGGPGGGFVSLWGRGAFSGFDGREGDLGLDGQVSTGFLGADWSSGADPKTGTVNWTAGLAVGHSTGTGGYRRGDCAPGDGENAPDCGGKVEAVLTGLYPYAGVNLSERLSLWLAAGWGSGEFTLRPDRSAALTADLEMAMGAAGVRGEVLRPEGGDGLTLAVKADARFTQTSTDAVRSAKGNLAAAKAETWLARAGIEGSRPVALGKDGAAVTPSFEVGVRLDGGDAETGIGADLGGGVAFADPASGLSLDLRGRGLVVHEQSGFREWGASAAFAWDPRPETDRGLSLSLTRSWGASPSGGMDGLLDRETLAGFAANDDDPASGDGFRAAGRLEGEIGYGMAMFGDRFTGTPNLGFALSDGGARDYRIGWRLTSAVRGDPGFEVSLDAVRREPANDNGAGTPVEHGVMLNAAIRW